MFNRRIRISWIQIIILIKYLYSHAYQSNNARTFSFLTVYFINLLGDFHHGSFSMHENCCSRKILCTFGSACKLTSTMRDGEQREEIIIVMTEETFKKRGTNVLFF